MCGINGIYSFDEGADFSPVIASMNDALSHRGPDAQGQFIMTKIGLGHRRLSIIDLNENANQPFNSSDGRFILVFNGEIYNYLNIKNQLRDYNFITESDTEVVLASFMKWGIACLEQFNGMFAFAIWDNEKEELFLARDRIGIKPLYYYQNDDFLIFASEVRALLKSGKVPKKLNQAVLSDYLRYQTVHGSETMVKDVKVLESGHYLIVNESGIENKRYWNPDNKDIEHSDNIKVEEGKIKELFFASVERRLVSDVPFGAFLSGGIDSSTVVAAMSEVSTSPVSTFSVVFDEKKYSEEKYAQIIADRFKTDHHVIRLKAIDLLNDIPEALSSMDHPSGDGINTYTVSKATKAAGITMALSGLGGDELFSGYPVFRQMEKFRQYYWLQQYPRLLRSMLGDMITAFKTDIKSSKLNEVLKKEKLDLFNIYPVGRRLYADKEIRNLISNYNPENKVFQLSGILKNNFQIDQMPYQSQISLLEMYSYMQHVLLRDTDQMSMAHALEARVPFLDHELIEFMLGVKDEYKLEGYPKKLLVDSLGDLLPKEVYDRQKMGFVFPWEQWIRNELYDFCVEKISYLSSLSSLNEAGLNQILQQFNNGSKKINWVMIWTLVVLANWLQENNIDE